MAIEPKAESNKLPTRFRAIAVETAAIRGGRRETVRSILRWMRNHEEKAKRACLHRAFPN